MAALRCPWVPFASGCRADGVLALPSWAASYLLLPTPRLSPLWAADLWQPRDTRSESRRPVCPALRAGRGEQEWLGAERPALGSQIRRAVNPTVPGDVPRPDGSGRVRLDRCQKHRQSRLCTVKPCAAVQPFVPRDALRLPRVTTVPYHIEAG